MPALANSDLRAFIERIKDRVLIEDVVRERVPELKRAGNLWVARCPFHEENTPSFKVDPRRGTWHCFGACSTGGDALSFMQRFDGSSFMEALETLANVVGEELPRFSTGARSGDSEHERLHELCARAAELYQKKLRGPEGEHAREYLAGRGLTTTALEAFGVGFAPAQGSPLVEWATRSGFPNQLLLEAGLARRNEEGRTYDFFRGRVTIPIRDRLGRSVGFGARLIGDGEGPKYVNTPETRLFQKGRLIYGLDRALPGARRSRHLVLVEGYTDVIAAHQVGLDNVVAMLGTATTEDHAALIRRSGARRVSLVFDGDEAGRRATMRALHGLLPLGLELDVVAPPDGQDPCDLLVREGAAWLTDLLARPTGWFEFLVQGLRGLPPAELSAAVDGVLMLLGRLQSPVHRDALVRDLAKELGLPEAGLRERFAALGERTRERKKEPEPPAPAPASPAPSAALARRAYEELIGTCLLDNSLIPAFAPWFAAAEAERMLGGREPAQGLVAILRVLGDLYESTDLAVDAARVMAVLAADPARDLVEPLEARFSTYAKNGAAPRSVAEGAARCLERLSTELKKRELEAAWRESDDPVRRAQVGRELHSVLRALKAPAEQE